jgi:aminopeptidase N
MLHAGLKEISMRTENAPLIRLEDYKPTDYRIDTVDLDFKLAPEATRVVARLAIVRREETAPATPLVLDGDELVLKGLSIDGMPLADSEYEATPERLTLKAPPEAPFTLEVVTEVNPTANSELMGLYRSNGTYTTQCEAEGFRRITYFLDRPDVLSVYTTRIEARQSEAPVLLGNGNPVKGGPVEGTDRHYAVWHDPFPKPAYLFALVGGDLAKIEDTFTTASGREVTLGIYCEHGREDRCHYAMDALKRSMRWDEERFGREYDLDVFNIVAVSHFNMGAMENKGLNIFNDRFVLVDPQTGTDQDYLHVEAVIAHEYFHNWTGNRITCRDWFQLCLKEGLTVFRDQQFTADMRSRPVKRISDVAALRQRQFPEDNGPLAHPVRPTAYREINNFYTATVYEKGAEICRMLQTVLGEDGFRVGMDLYFDRHDGDASTIEDFLACFTEATGADLGHFALWYHQAGTPTVKASHDYDAASERLTLTLEQINPPTPGNDTTKPLHIPIRFGLVGPDGQDLSFSQAQGGHVEGGVIHLDKARTEFVFEGVKAEPVPSLLRGFSAPVHLETDLSVEQRIFLVGHDPDPFNRWEAAQTLALDMLKKAASGGNKNDEADFDERFFEAFALLAANEDLDPAFRALALSLPTETDIAHAIGKDVNPDAVHAARTDLKRRCGERMANEALTAAERNCPASDYSPDAAEAGRRALLHASWDLALAADPAISEMIAASFELSENLTERFAALRLLVHGKTDEAEAMLQKFFERYRDDLLVLDKWFAIQATVPGADTLDKVKSLTKHPAFSMETPNKVYALIRSFGAANPTAFNRPDGEGYRFLAAIIGELDPQNPSVAARIATCFGSFRMLEPVRREAARLALEELAGRESLSRDVSDILTRTLQDSGSETV